MAILACLGVCGSFVGAFGCKGSEHVVLAPILISPAQPSGGTEASGSGGSSGHDSGSPDSPPDAVVPEFDSGLEIDPELNPDVTFEWPETPTGQGKCGPGTFAGSFSCTFPDYPLTPYAGQVSFTLTAVPDAQEALFVLIGELADPLGVGLSLFYTVLTGTLDCGNNQLLAGGREGIAFAQPQMPSGPFSSSLSGTYFRDQAEIKGDVFLTFGQNQVCSGVFLVGASP
jgi:hypothetical protein